MILGIGTDIIEISRVKKALQRPSFLARVYTKQEIAYALSRGAQKAASLAARFAGKEAVMKALGTGLRNGTFKEIEILTDRLGEPFVNLSGGFLAQAKARGVKRIQLSLSHAREYATAICVMEGNDETTDSR